VNLEQARAETLRLLGGDVPQTPKASGAPAQPAQGQRTEKKSKTPALDHFCRDLTALAGEGQLDPTIGRQSEIERVIEVLPPIIRELRSYSPFGRDKFEQYLCRLDAARAD